MSETMTTGAADLDIYTIMKIDALEQSGIDDLVDRWEGLIESIIVVTDEDHERAGQILETIGNIQTHIHKRDDPVCSSAYQTHQLAVKSRKKSLAPWDKMETLTKAAIGVKVKRDFDAEQLAASKGETEEEIAGPGDDVSPITVIAETRRVVPGAKTRMKAVVSVDDPKAFLRAIASKKIPMGAITINQKWLNDMAKQLGDGFTYPGCSISMEPVVSK